MTLKELTEKYKVLYKNAAALQEAVDENAKEMKDTEQNIKIKMTDENVDSLDACGFVFSRLDKVFFKVKAEDHDAMIAWFKADPELKNLVKIKEDVHYQSMNKVWRDMYEDTNAVPPFVEVSPVTVLEIKPIKEAK
jgi:hypothetical protein